jgi:3-oxoacyl-[acyl-carrier protein] reductase
MDLSLSGKTALVCGSTQGIGRASALELSKLGARCVLMARNEARLQEVLSALDPTQQEHAYLVADFSDPHQVSEAVNSWLSRYPVHILVNNTGGPPAGALLDAKPEDFLQAYRQQLICAHLLAQAVVPGMKQAAYGRIINIISTSVKTPLPHLGVSNTTRWAVAAWAKTLATEVAADGITVNNVLPGSTMTRRLKKLFELQAKTRHSTYEAMEAAAREEIPMKRFAQAEDIASVVAFLATPAAGYVTGTSIQVDGGKTPAP